MLNKEITSLIRSTGYELIKQIGKKILSGNFNLTTISIPIQVMVPLTILQSIARSVFQFPVYFTKAAMTNDLLERFKYVITASISTYHCSSHFLKPMNPVLGETYEAVWEDGSQIYLEQTSHHPPISHFLLLGPNNSYKFYGFSNFATTAGLNSLKLENKGKRNVEFKDGFNIQFDYCYELYSNSFFGTLRHESLGEIHYKELTTGMECVLKFDGIKKK